MLQELRNKHYFSSTVQMSARIDEYTSIVSTNCTSIGNYFASIETQIKRNKNFLLLFITCVF